MTIPKKYLVLTACALGVLLAWYLASPFLAVQNLRSAAMKGDVDRLERLVDFPQVRESLKGQLNAQAMKAMQDDPELAGNPFAGLAMVMVPAIVERALDAYVTPDGLAAIMKGDGSSKAKAVEASPPASKAARSGEPDWSYGYKDLNTFQIATVEESTPDGSTAFTMRREGMFRWRLTRIRVPEGLFDTTAP